MEGYKEFLDAIMTPEVKKMMENDPFMHSRYKKLTKKYRCKVCRTFTVEKSDKNNICIECRKEYLNRSDNY